MLKRILAPAALSLMLLSGQSWSEPTYTVNFEDSDIQKVIKFIADVTDRTVVIDQRVKGRVKVISEQPLNKDQLLDLFRTVLEVNDYTTIDSDGILRVVPMKDARSSPVPVTNEQTSEKGFITQVIQLKNISAVKFLPIIRALVPQHSHLVAYDPANVIVVSDFKANIDRIRNLIERVDKSAVPETEIVELKYASAEDMVATLGKLDKNTKKNSNSSKQLGLVADKRNNAVLITGEDLQRERIKTLISRLDRPKSQTGSVRVVYLNYAKAKTTAEVLTKVVSNLSKLGPGGAKGATKQAGATVEADEDTNALLITADGDTLQSLLSVVERLDIRRAQVLVEAIIVELDEDASRELGFEYFLRDGSEAAFAASGATAEGFGALGAGLAGAAENVDPNSVDAITNVATALVGSGPGQILGVIGTNNDLDFGVIMKVLESNSKNNILSTPTLLTMDNNEASFSVGQNVPFESGSFSNTGSGISSPFRTVQRQDVGIILKVTPHVNEGDKVILEISQEISSVAPDSGGTGDIITNQRKLETKVMAADGEIIVMGGLVQEDAKRSETRVPILGSIPLLGTLFRSSDKKLKKANLMIFLRASVIREDEQLTGATAEKYEYIRNRQIAQSHKGFLRGKSRGLPVLPDMSAYNLQAPFKVEKLDAKPADNENATEGSSKGTVEGSEAVIEQEASQPADQAN